MSESAGSMRLLAIDVCEWMQCGRSHFVIVMVGLLLFFQIRLSKLWKPWRQVRAMLLGREWRQGLESQRNEVLTSTLPTRVAGQLFLQSLPA